MFEIDGTIQEIGLAGYRHGRSLSSDEIDATVRQIMRISMASGAAQFMLPETIHAIRPRIDKGQVIVHRTNDQIDGACGYEYLDVQTQRYMSNQAFHYRIVELRGLVVAAPTRRIGIGWRLVRQACLQATILSPHERGTTGSALRAICCVAAIDRANIPALELAASMGALIDDVEGPVVSSHPALRAFAIRCVEAAGYSGRPVPVIAVFRNVDLVEAALMAQIGKEGHATTEFGARIETYYDHWWPNSSQLASAIESLAKLGIGEIPDPYWLRRLGIEGSTHTDGMGHVFWSDVTAEMTYGSKDLTPPA